MRLDPLAAGRLQRSQQAVAERIGDGGLGHGRDYAAAKLSGQVKIEQSPAGPILAVPVSAISRTLGTDARVKPGYDAEGGAGPATAQA
jgi:hypothetical protein